MPPRPDIVVTGLGVVSAWGWGRQPLRAALGGRTTAIGSFGRFDHAAYSTHVAAEVPEAPQRLDVEPPGPWRRRSMAERFALAAAAEALADAALPSDLAAADAGVYFGSSTGGMLETEEFYAARRGRPLDGVPLSGLAAQQVNRPADAVARAFRATGEVATVSSACASGALALGLALEALRDGRVSVALAGGADSLCRLTFGGFNALQSVAELPCRPFRAGRRGLSLGEGAAVLVLERAADAAARGARPLARLLGSGASADAHHMTAPEPAGRGAAAAVARALADAGETPAAIDFINAHGTGTELNDLAEYRALASVFGERLRTIPLASTKASVGHLLGSAGAIEAAATVLALHEQRLQPTPGEGELDERTPVSLAPEPAAARLGVALSLNLGFGGCNGALVLARAGPS